MLPVRCPAFRQRDLNLGFCVELGNLSSWCKGRDSNGINHENLSTNTRHRGGLLRSSVETSVMEVERRE